MSYVVQINIDNKGVKSTVYCGCTPGKYTKEIDLASRWSSKTANDLADILNVRFRKLTNPGASHAVAVLMK